ncbi:MAG: sigma-70 family RNA polymerase sigma factor [Hyphomonas oceanitis]|uniref:RNA polymerase sigma factor n=1 Tax=Hyphomonas oceanitis TaxID=81033 RepID=UPI003003585B
MSDVSSKDGFLTAATAEAPVVSSDFESFYRVHWPDLCTQLKRAFGQGPPEPEDVAQAAFLKWVSLDDTSRIKNHRAFLYTIAKNILLEAKRDSARKAGFANTLVEKYTGSAIEDVTPERVLMNKQRFDLIWEAIALLPEKQRTIVRMHRIEGQTYQQIVEATGWSYGDVYRQMDRALAALSTALVSLT